MPNDKDLLPLPKFFCELDRVIHNLIERQCVPVNACARCTCASLIPMRDNEMFFEFMRVGWSNWHLGCSRTAVHVQENRIATIVPAQEHRLEEPAKRDGLKLSDRMLSWDGVRIWRDQSPHAARY